MSRVNVERLAAHVMEAAEQTERLDLPEVAEPRRLSELLESWPADRRIILCAEAGAAAPIAEALAGLPARGPLCRHDRTGGRLCVQRA